MSKHDEYRRQAEYCVKMATKAFTLEGRAAWLRLADKWTALAAGKKPPLESADPGTAPREARGYKDSSSTD